MRVGFDALTSEFTGPAGWGRRWLRARFGKNDCKEQREREKPPAGF
jgi:hypothetical protein